MTIYDDLPELMVADEVAKVLRVHPATVRALCRDGKLACVKLGRKWLIRKDSVIELLRPVRLAGGRILTLQQVDDAITKSHPDEDQDTYVPPADQRRLFDGGQHGAGVRGDGRPVLTPRIIGM